MKRKRMENGEEEIDDGQQPCFSKAGSDGTNQTKRTNKSKDKEDGNEEKVTKEQTAPSNARQNWSILSTKLLYALKEKNSNPPRTSIFKFSRKKDSTYQIYLESPYFSASIDLNPFFNSLDSSSSLRGFDNTGNVRLWSGGEALALYFLENPSSVKDKKVLELGAGFMGLPSLASSKFGRKMIVTDGNEQSVSSLGDVIRRNEIMNLEARTLKWGEDELEGERFDVILAADCVFFKNFHLQLLECCSSHLTDDGCVLICSPKRKGSLQVFIEKVESAGKWSYEYVQCFEEMVRSRISIEKSQEDLELPYLIKMTRK